MLFIMRGTSCSGKDTFLEQYFVNGGPNIISSDYFRQMLFGNVSEQRYNEDVFKMIHQVIESRMIHRAEWTVLNSTNLKMSDLRVPIELCKKYHTPFTFLSLEPPSVEELKIRNQKRYKETGFLIPDSVLERHYAKYFNSRSNFIQEAANNPYCSFIEFNQKYEVLEHVC